MSTKRRTDVNGVCLTCGETHRPGYCAAHNRQGRPCGFKAILGGTVCSRQHGGKARQVQNAANRRLELQAVEADARAFLAHHGVTSITDPLVELGKLASEVVAMKDALGARVNALHEIRYAAAGAGTEQLRAEVVLLERAQDRAGKFLDLLVKAGFEERVTRIQEDQGALVADAIRRILDALHLTDEQTQLVPTIVPGVLRSIGGAS